MEKLSTGQRRLIGEFLSNIGVAWFAAGVISSFASSPKNTIEAVISFIWGIVFSAGFLRIAISITKGVES